MSSSGNDRYAFRGGLNPEKRKQDLAASFPKVGRCLKCFKHLIIDPEARCTIEPGKKNCARCTKGGGKCELIPRSCAEACRAWEEKIDAFAAWLAANPSQHVANPDDPQDWVFEDWLDSYKLKDSSRRIKDAQDDETWEGVPGIYKDVYLTGVELMDTIHRERGESSAPGASSADNMMLSAVRDLTNEIRAFREAYMFAHYMQPTEEETIPASVARFFTKF